MKIARIVSVAVLASVFFSSALAADDQQAARAKYSELAAKVRAGDLVIDWQALRVAAVIGVVGNPSEEFQAVKDGYAALSQGKFEDALKLAREVEDQNIADADAHYVAWRSLVELGRQDEAEKERRLLVALMDSIMKTGDGKSADTAWFAATIREEYLVMQMMLNVQFQSQHSQRIGDHYYDVVAVKDQSGKEMILWFNTDTDFRRMQAITDRYNQKQSAK
jgi:tetratricopeptide (TPR) repeat protein